MVSRPIWKGQLRLSLVAIPVEFYNAARSGARVSFRQIHKPSGKPVNYQKVVPGIGPVAQDDIFSGYEFAKDEYILIDPAEIDAIKLETRKTFELVQFVEAREISPLYFDKPYYVAPADDLAQDAYRVVRDALRSTGKVGLGQITMRGREYLAAVKPCGDGLLAETLRYADEIGAAEPLFSEIKDAESDPELLEVATALIARKTAPFKAENFQDHYAVALRDLLEAKRANRKTPRVATGKSGPAPADNVVDLMAALRQSLDKAGGKAASPKPAKAAKPAPPKPAAAKPASKPRAPRAKKSA